MKLFARRKTLLLTLFPTAVLITSALLAKCCLLLTATDAPPHLLDLIANDEWESGGLAKWQSKRSNGGSKIGDLCSQNTDCQNGMYCFNSVCTCLSNYVAIAEFCWPKVNPGESGCAQDQQCEAVWPGAKCSRIGLCDCPEHMIPTKTRDGTVCISEKAPPSCPFPESNNPLAPNPATLLANPTNHPLAPGTYIIEVTHSNGGDGSSSCVYPDGDKDIYIADIYNCVAHPLIRHEFFPEYAETVDGICCHSRAFTCIQPMVQGDEPSLPRWWYNAVTGTCSQFLWDPTQNDNVSPNNFRTLEHCESYCRDTCKRGPVQFARHSRSSLIEETPVTNCMHIAGSCSPEFTCSLIGSQQQCCPTVGQICSPTGGRALMHYQPSKDIFDSGVQIAGSEPISRYFYDSEQGKCTNFGYHGGLGNFNNFLTKQDCDNFCSKLVCEYGTPLRIDDDWQRCETNIECPNSHSCETSHRVCCPTAQTICTQPKIIGDCTGSVNRYWYNAAVQQCEMFQYTGCQGNENNFQQLLECQRKCKNISLEPKCPQGRAHRDAASGHFSTCATTSSHYGGKFGEQNDGSCPAANHYCHFDGITHGCCPAKPYTCALGPDKGVQCGSGRSFRYFFNPERQQCESFQYEGCDGNSNNFNSLESCEEYCGVGGCPNGGRPLRDEKTNQWAVCLATANTNDCPTTHECVPINVNGNIAHRCCQTKAYICSLPPQQGNLCTKTSIVRWYFNIVTKECGKFSFDGCNGNLNNFESAEECTNFCSSAGCAPGEVAMKQDYYAREFSLDEEEDWIEEQQQQQQQSTGSVVIPSSVGGSEEDSAAKQHDADHHYAISSFFAASLRRRRRKREVVQCSTGLKDNCPSDYKCTYDPLTSKHVCCGTPSYDICPPGERPYVNAVDESVRECSANVPGSCPANFFCRFSPIRNKYFCCQLRTGSMCPKGRALYRAPKTLNPVPCTLKTTTLSEQINACPNGFSCQSQVEDDTSGYCCSAHNICKSGSDFLLDERTQLPKSCVPGAFYTCPQGYGCHSPPPGRGTAAGSGYCCRSELAVVVDIGGCPPGEVTYTQNDKVVECDPFSQKNKGCPDRYTCQYSAGYKRYQCCGNDLIVNPGGGQSEEKEDVLNGGCPVGMASSERGTPRPCTSSGPSTCPLGFSCQFSDVNKQYQCCAQKADCPSDSVAYIELSGGPKRCSLLEKRMAAAADGDLSCPRGYSCQHTTSSKDKDKDRTICCTATDRLEREQQKDKKKKKNSAKKNGTTTSAEKSAPQTEPPKIISTTNSTTKDLSKSQQVKSRPGSTKSNELQVINCLPNEILVDGVCVPRKIGQSCLDDRHCPRTALCRDFTCVCPPGTIKRGNECVGKVTKSTDKDKNKKDKGGKSSSSKRKEILKKENEEKSDEKTPPRGKKRPKIPKNRVRVQIAEERGDEDDEEQEGETGEEICSDEEIQVNGRCLVKNVPLGGECLLPEQCSNEAKCLRHKCRCPRGMGGFRNHCYSHVCGSNRFKTPQVSPVGNVVKCGGDSHACSRPYRCTFSPILHTHICCRPTSTKITVGEILIDSSSGTGTGSSKKGEGRAGKGSEKKEKSGETGGKEVSSIAELIARRNQKIEDDDEEDSKSRSSETTTEQQTRNRWNVSNRLTSFEANRSKRCPDGTKPYLYPSTPYPLKCSSRSNCPRGYTCKRGSICCPHSSSSTSTENFWSPPAVVPAFTVLSSPLPSITKWKVLISSPLQFFVD